MTDIVEKAAPVVPFGQMIVGTEKVNIRFFGVENSLPIPYAFSIGAVTIVGTLYLRDPLENSYTDGVIAGAVNGTYHIDRDNTEACATGIVKLCIRIDFGDKCLYAELCTPCIFPPGWDCHGERTLICW